MSTKSQLVRVDAAMKRISWHVETGYLTEAWVLKSFDLISRALSVKLTGEEGVLLGFDALEVHAAPNEEGHSVTVSATLLEEKDSRHAVEYRVAVRSISRSKDGRVPEVVVARAAGWTWTPSRGPLSGALSLTPAVGLLGTS